jgi:hypothetical protein
MLRFFKSPQPAIMIIIPVIILAFWVRSANHIVETVYSGVPLWDTIASVLARTPNWLAFIILYLIVCAEAIYLNLMLNRHEVIYKNTFVPALIFTLFISLTPVFMQFHPIHIVNLLLIRVFDRLFTLFKSEQPVSALFDSGFLSGLAALLFFPSAMMLILLMTALVALRPFRLKEWLIMIIGFMLPFFFSSVYFFWIHALPAFWADYLGHFRNIHSSLSIVLNTPLKITFVFIGLLLLFSFIKLRANYRKNIIRMRTYQQIFFIFLVIAGGSLLMLKNIHLIDFLHMLIPITVFCSYYFVSSKKRIYLYEYALWAMVALIIWNQA